MSKEKYPIKATSHILNLLGNELIGSDSLAIFELVKNSYDADAENVFVKFVDLNSAEQRIIIEDDGSGMSPDIVHNVWLTIGTNYKRKEAKISNKYHRVSLGNKGVGRLAVHRLADNIILETQTADDMFGSKLEINWKQLVKSGDYIDDLEVEVEHGDITPFSKGHGTRITLTSLKTKKWTKANLRELVRKINNFKNPFEEIKNFNVEIDVTPEEYKKWIEDINTPTDILDRSLFFFKFDIKQNLAGKDENATFEWEYSFRPQNFGNLNLNNKNNRNEAHKTLSISKRTIECLSDIREQLILKNKDLDNIGDISGIFHVFNQNGKILDFTYGTGNREGIKTYIKENCGVKIFRDNIRVYNYGEPSDDWLGLELSKIQRAGDHFSKKVTVSAVSLDLARSESGLIEKTNREGFSENDTYWIFREVVKDVFNFFERTSDDDRQKVEAILEDTTVNKRVGLSDTILELELKLKEKNLANELKPLIKKVESDYNEMRDVMLNSGMTGLNLGLVFHEVEREMRFINTDLKEQNIDINLIKERVKTLMLLLENFSPILKQNSKTKLSASKLISRILQINQSRFNYHKIIFSSPLLSNENKDFNVTGPGNLLLSAVSNIIDNAIYWVSYKRELMDNTYKPAIFIGTDMETFGAPAIIIADNGTGFQLDPEIMVQPFKTNRPDGMGLGLYFVNLVLETMGGKLIFPDNKDLDIPKAYDGACLALVFTK